MFAVVLCYQLSSPTAGPPSIFLDPIHCVEPHYMCHCMHTVAHRRSLTLTHPLSPLSARPIESPFGIHFWFLANVAEIGSHDKVPPAYATVESKSTLNMVLSVFLTLLLIFSFSNLFC